MSKSREESAEAARRIGIFAGTFNPVHSGHIGFALQTLEGSVLDAVYFLPERLPRGKEGVEHFAHRVAMLKRAVRPYPKLHVLELNDRNFTVARTLPQLQKRFPGQQLVFLFGSDVVQSLPEWPHADRLLLVSELVVATRAGHKVHELDQAMRQWPHKPRAVAVIKSLAPDVSSARIREALRRQKTAKGLLASVGQYSRQHWLYVSAAGKIKGG